MTTDPTVTAHVCAYCGRPAEGNYSIHRDGFCDGPEVDLCDAHGGRMTPTCPEIWDRLADRKARGHTMTEVA